ncbi:MAG: ABC transporter permease [Bacteroidota bacterium]
MIKFLVKNSIRSIFKDKYQFLLNFIGLALGFAAYLFITAYFLQEKSFDQFHTKSERLFRIVASVKMGDTGNNISNSEVPITHALKTEVPEVEDATRLYFNNNVGVKVGENKYVERRFWYADANVFQLFDFELKKGDKREALIQPNTIVITTWFAKKYFGDTDPIGKTIELNNSGELYEVTGILQDLPANSHLQFDMLASFSSIDFSSDYSIDQWGNFRDLYSYILLKENVDLPKVNKKLQEIVIKYYTPKMESIGMSYSDFIEGGNYVNHNLQPLNEIHLDPTYTDEAIVHGNKQLLFALGLTGLLIIIIACFNFINLSTARATLRAKEIGIKKIIGSGKKRIVGQLLLETFLQCVFALIASLVLLLLTQPLFNYYTGLNIQLSQFLSGLGLISILGIFLFVVGSSGLFPSIVISRFNPAEIIKGKILNWNTNAGQRNVLVTFQFIIFIIMVCSTIIVKKQISYLHHQNPGFHKENVLIIENTDKLGQSSQTFKQELAKNPDVISTAYSTSVPSQFNDASNPFSKTDKENQIFLDRLECDADFLSTLDIKLLDGRNFTPGTNNESKNALINQSAAKAFGWSDVNDKVIFDYNDGGEYFNVIGIVEDFHITSLRERIEPMIIRYQKGGEFLSIRIRPESATSIVNATKDLWDNLNEEAPFEYSFLDASFDNQYKQETLFGKLVSLFSMMSVSIACLGLLGLISFTLSRKQKEIGVRKVNGAKVSEILANLNKDFVRWIVISFIIATPLAWYIAHKWLENFAYKTELSWWVFALAGLLALAIALLTVSWQSWKAATRNPVEALRYE